MACAADLALQNHKFTSWSELRERFPDSVILAGAGPETLTYNELQALVGVLRPSFAAAGLCPGDRVAALLPNGPEAAALFLGSILCGLCFGPLDPQLTKSELEFALKDLPARALLLGQLSSVVASLAEMVARDLDLILLHLAGGGSLSSLHIEITIAASTQAAAALVPRSASDVALALHTSGSTRRPKLVPLSHENLCSGAISIAQTLKLQPEDVVMNCLPLFHIHGLAVNVLVPAIAGATSVCLSGTFDAVAAMKRLGAGPAITLYSAVPSLHQALVTSLMSLGSADFPALRLIRNCSAHLPAALASAVSTTLGAEVLPTYAMTESMPIASPSPRHDRCGTHRTVGFAAGPQVALLTGAKLGELEACEGKIVEDLSEGLTGEVCVKGSCVTRGYEARLGHDPNLDAFVDGWLRTGDLATVAADGLILSGRCKEIINKAGEKFSPMQIEDVYLQHPSIEDCVAFAAPCEKRGEAIGLAIQSEAADRFAERGSKAQNACNLDSLRMFGRRTQELRVVALPDCLVWLRRLPRTATGKKLRLGLAEILGMPKLQGDHGEWYAIDAIDVTDVTAEFERDCRDPKESAGYSSYSSSSQTRSKKYVLHPAPRFATQEVSPKSGAGVYSLVRQAAMELIRCDFQDNQPLLDLGIDSLSATSFINSLESHLDINLAGDEGAVAFLDKYPSLENVVQAVLKAQGVAEKDDTADVGSKMSKKVAPLRYFGLGRPDLKQFIVDTRDPTSLLYAAQHGREETIRSRCTDRRPDEEVDKNGLTALHYAAGRGDKKIVMLLLELKAGVDTRNKDLRTPLMWAARNGHLDVCEELVRNKADIHAANKLGINCLHWAAWGGSLEAVAFLLERRADINAVCHAGCNVAVWAATAGSFDMCQWLHEKRADFAATNKNGHGVLNKAAWRGHSEKLVSWMLSLDGVEAQLYAPDWEGELPLDRARQKGHTSLADWLHHEMCKRRPEMAKESPCESGEMMH